MNKKDRYELYRYSVGPGWWDILDRYVPQLQALDPQFDFYIKEKYGVLRIYATSELVPCAICEKAGEDAELESATVCENCGAPGRLRTNLSWLQTLCDRCLAADPEQRRHIDTETEQRWLKQAAEEL